MTDSDNNTATDIHSASVGGPTSNLTQQDSLTVNGTLLNKSSSVEVLPQEIILKKNYPNPFNPETVINFALPQGTHVTLTVYSINGEKIAELANGYFAEGYHQLKWDGRNNAGYPVSSGIYIYALRVGERLFTRKMTLLR